MPTSRSLPSSLLSTLRQRAAQKGDSTVYTYWSETGTVAASLTYSALERATAQLATSLIQASDNSGRKLLNAGDRVVLVYLPSLDFIVAFIACLRAGLVAVPVYPPDPRNLRVNVSLFASVCTSCGAKVALSHAAYTTAVSLSSLKDSALRIFGVGKAEQVKWPELQWVKTDVHGNVSDVKLHAATTPSGGRRLLDAHASDLAFLQYTSGSTSEPKGVMVTHGNLAHNLGVIVRSLKAGPDTIVASWLPQYHDMGLIGSYLGVLYCGGSGCYMSPLSFIKRPLLWLKMIHAFGATHVQAPNFAYALVARKFREAVASTAAATGGLLSQAELKALNLSSLKHCFNAAEPITATALSDFASTFLPLGFDPTAMACGYGLAENTVYVSDGGSEVIAADRQALERDRKVVICDSFQISELHTVAKERLRQDKNTAILVSCGPVYPYAVGKNEDVAVVIVDSDASQAATASATPAGDAMPDDSIRLPTAIPQECVVGEVWIASSSKAAGYWGTTELSAEAFAAHLAAPPVTRVANGASPAKPSSGSKSIDVDGGSTVAAAAAASGKADEQPDNLASDSNTVDSNTADAKVADSKVADSTAAPPVDAAEASRKADSIRDVDPADRENGPAAAPPAAPPVSVVDSSGEHKQEHDDGGRPPADAGSNATAGSDAASARDKAADAAAAAGAQSEAVDGPTSTVAARIATLQSSPFLRSGDLGFIYHGQLYIAGRLKDLIILRGRNFYPSDLEQVVESSDNHGSQSRIRPGCTAAFATGPGLQEVVVAAEVRPDPASSSSPEQLQSIAEGIKMAVMRDFGIRLSAVVLLKPHGIQKTTSGKVARRWNARAWERLEAGDQGSPWYASRGLVLSIVRDPGAVAELMGPETSAAANGGSSSDTGAGGAASAAVAGTAAAVGATGAAAATASAGQAKPADAEAAQQPLYFNVEGPQLLAYLKRDVAQFLGIPATAAAGADAEPSPAAGQSDAAAAPPQPQLTAQTLPSSVSLLHLGLDSLSLMQLQGKLAAEYGIVIKDELMFDDATTLQWICAHAEELRGDAPAAAAGAGAPSAVPAAAVAPVTEGTAQAEQPLPAGVEIADPAALMALQRQRKGGKKGPSQLELNCPCFLWCCGGS